MRLWRFVDICRIVSDEGVRGFCVFVGICRIMSDEGRARLWRFVDNCRIVSVEGKSEALVFLSVFVALCRSRVGARLLRFCR